MRVISALIISTAMLIATASLAPAAASAHGDADVAMTNYAFSPSTLTLMAGDTVTWTNSDQAPHDVQTTSAPVSVHSSTLAKGQSWSYTFTEPGTYQYICSFHPDMRATVVVHARPATATARPTQQAPRITQTPPRTTTITPARTTVQAPVTQRRSASRAAASVTTHATPPTSASPPPVAAAAAPSQPSLRPLLLVAGLVAAVATFCLLMLATQPRRSAGAG